jgi:hypothetical protein
VRGGCLCGKVLPVACLFALAACAPLHALDCNSGERRAVQDSLYFGTAKPTGAVTADEWVGFLDAVVTPRFPEGLTVSDASGH